MKTTTTTTTIKMTTPTTRATVTDRRFASQFVPSSWMNERKSNDCDRAEMKTGKENKIKNDSVMYKEEVEDDERDTTDEDDVTNERGREKTRGATTRVLSNLKQRSREKKKENKKIEFMNTIIEEQKLLLVDERERSNQFEEQMKLLQKSVKFLEKECESLSAKMSEMFQKNAEKAHLNERILQAERAAMLSARETKRVVEENRESHHVIREQNKRINTLEKRLEEQMRKLDVSKKANELMRVAKDNKDGVRFIEPSAVKLAHPIPTPPTKQLAPEEIDWEAAYREIDELRKAKRNNAR